MRDPRRARWRPHRHVAPKQRDVGYGHAAPQARGGVPQHQRRLGISHMLPRDIGVVVHELEQAAAHHGSRQRFHTREPRFHGAGNVVARASGDRIVELAPDEGAPCELEQGTPVAPPGAAGERGERFGQPLQKQLRRRAAALEWRPGRVHALERPGVAVRPAQLARQRRRLGAVGHRLKELLEPRHPECALRLELGEQVAQA